MAPNIAWAVALDERARNRRKRNIFCGEHG